MQATVKTIKEFTTGNSIYPVTKADAVYMANSTKTVQGVLGDTDISGIGDGTLTSAVSVLNSNVMNSSADVITSTLSSGTVADHSVVKSGKVINILFFVRDTSTPATGRVATLPAGYRPQGVRYLMGEIIVNNNRIPMRFNVDANGNISLSYGNITMTQVEIAGTIPL